MGPLFFIIYINDIPNICEIAKFILYADDANILISGNTIYEIEQKFEILSRNFENWINLNGLTLNVKKTNFMIFANRKIDELHFSPKIFNWKIERKQSSRFLGVIINENLTWKDHILAIRAKMSRYVGILYKLKKYCLYLHARTYFIVLSSLTLTTARLSGDLEPNLM